MTINYSDELIEYMDQRHKDCILVDIASSNTCDLDVTEMYLRFISDSHADRLLNAGKGYRFHEAPRGRLIIPPYNLNIQDTVSVYLKTFLFFKLIKQDGITL